MLALGIRYLTGYAAAAELSNRERAEWPPHPARVFMAMAAAMYETGEDPEERAALEWLEKQDAPSMRFSDAEPRGVVTCYVPPNDMAVPADPVKLKPAAVSEAMNVLPAYRLRKQPRSFPRVRPTDDTVFLIWPSSEPGPSHRSALDRLCAKVTRIGHSSSLVQMWVEERPPEANFAPAELGRLRLRVTSAGTLGQLSAMFNRDSIEAYAELQDRIGRARGKAKKQLQQELKERFGDTEPTSVRPTISQWQAYMEVGQPGMGAERRSGAFDPNILVLAIDEGPSIGLVSTWQFLTALRDTILSTCDPTPEWVSGHTPEKAPSQRPHLALFPLGFVGHEHADGHLMGVGLAFPKEIVPRQRGRALQPLLYDGAGQPKKIELRVGSLGVWTLSRETRLSPPISLQPITWTGASDTWATVTPISLDRQPKTDRSKDREGWSQEVAEIIADSCERQGLPRPAGVDVDKTSWFRGVPRAVCGPGAGFPLSPVKSGQARRQQVHAWLRFRDAIEGPLLLGAGRYRGYGLCRPWTEERQ